MLVNHAIEAARGLRLKDRLLRKRAAAQRERVPVVFVPPMLGTRLRDDRGHRLWGWTRCVFFGPPVGRAAVVVPDGLLSGLSLVPGIYSHDVHGGLLRYLARTGSYRAGDDLFALTYDWRQGVAHAAACLAALLNDLRARGMPKVDLVCASSGGLVARYFMMYGGRDVLAGEPPTPGWEGLSAVRRTVYLGTPQRGTLEALNVLQNGFQLLPVVGKAYPADDMVTCQISYDLLPHPDDPVFVDADSAAVERELYDTRVWRELGLDARSPHHLGELLARARRLHRAISHRVPAQDAFTIGADHRPTRVRVMIERGKANVPYCWIHERTPPVVRGLGDGSVSAHSLCALPGGDPARKWIIAPNQHHDLPSDPTAHRYVLEALIARSESLGAGRRLDVLGGEGARA